MKKNLICSRTFLKLQQYKLNCCEDEEVLNEEEWENGKNEQE
jgi:hypothetical protein